MWIVNETEYNDSSEFQEQQPIETKGQEILGK
jgi:hypothetical protein